MKSTAVKMLLCLCDADRLCCEGVDQDKRQCILLTGLEEGNFQKTFE